MLEFSINKSICRKLGHLTANVPKVTVWRVPPTVLFMHQNSTTYTSCTIIVLFYIYKQNIFSCCFKITFIVITSVLFLVSWSWFNGIISNFFFDYLLWAFIVCFEFSQRFIFV
jgi:hypothetical protein